MFSIISFTDYKDINYNRIKLKHLSTYIELFVEH